MRVGRENFLLILRLAFAFSSPPTVFFLFLVLTNVLPSLSLRLDSMFFKMEGREAGGDALRGLQRIRSRLGVKPAGRLAQRENRDQA